MSPTAAPALELVPASRRRAALLPGADTASRGGMPSRSTEETLESSSGTTVTTPPEIIPYYHLNHSIWSLSDNKEASR
jgi:hypothetical protein